MPDFPSVVGYLVGKGWRIRWAMPFTFTVRIKIDSSNAGVDDSAQWLRVATMEWWARTIGACGLVWLIVRKSWRRLRRSSLLISAPVKSRVLLRCVL